MSVGSGIKRHLQERKMTIKQLSQKTGISINTLYSITKRNSTRINKEALNKIASALSITPEQLIEGTPTIFSDFLDATGLSIRSANALIESKTHASALNRIFEDERFPMLIADLAATMRKGAKELPLTDEDNYELRFMRIIGILRDITITNDKE